MIGGAIGALAASLALFAFIPQGEGLEGQLIDAQARSLEAQHLVDVTTSDRHVVKPWFNGQIDFAPPVVDLKDQGYPLVGGRLDRVAGRRVAALVFYRGPHTINLFIWPGDGPASPALEKKDGYSLVHWGANGLTFWAVSDVDAAGPHRLPAGLRGGDALAQRTACVGLPPADRQGLACALHPLAGRPSWAAASGPSGIEFWIM